jgi:hypothetical protein
MSEEKRLSREHVEQAVEYIFKNPPKKEYPIIINRKLKRENIEKHFLGEITTLDLYFTAEGDIEVQFIDDGKQ